MAIVRLLATGFLGGDWRWLFITVYVSFGALCVIATSAIVYNAYLTFALPKQRSRQAIIFACVASVIATFLLFAGSFVFAPDGNNYFLRLLAFVTLVLTCTGTTRAWRASRQTST